MTYRCHTQTNVTYDTLGVVGGRTFGGRTYDILGVIPRFENLRAAPQSAQKRHS